MPSLNIFLCKIIIKWIYCRMSSATVVFCALKVKRIGNRRRHTACKSDNKQVVSLKNSFDKKEVSDSYYKFILLLKEIMSLPGNSCWLLYIFLNLFYVLSYALLFFYLFVRCLLFATVQEYFTHANTFFIEERNGFKANDTPGRFSAIFFFIRESTLLTSCLISCTSDLSRKKGLL